MKSFFKPESIAVVGATASEKKVGYAVLRNILRCGYRGRIYPVNPRRREILGLRVYNSLKELPEVPELAVLVVPPAACVEAVNELAKAGTKAFLVISAGFKETGEEGAELERRLVELTRSYGARVVGPNCLGVMDTHTPLNATFATVMPPKGNVAVVSQSGALLSAFFDWSIEEGVGFSKVVSLGNQADVELADVVEYLAEDRETEVILAYLEGARDGRRLIEALKKASLNKPVLVLKVGRTGAGSRASSSHTGSITGSDDAYAAAFRKAGAIRVDSMEELFLAAKVFSCYRPVRVGSVVVLTNAGGPGIMVADAVENSTLRMAELSSRIKELLTRVLPPVASVANPVDVIGDADAARYRESLGILLEAEEVDSVIVLLTPQLMTEIAETARALVSHRNGKPVVAAFMGEDRVAEGVEILRAGGIPSYRFPEHTVYALDMMNRYLDVRGGYSLEGEFTFDLGDRVQELLVEHKNYGALDQYPAKGLVKLAGIPVPRGRLVRSEDEAVSAAQEMGFPVVMKLSSPYLLHKTDVGGVRVGLKGEDEVRRAFRELVDVAASIGVEVRGVLVEEMAPDGVDLIVGFKRDATFGPVVVVGLGGVYVEILKDVAYGVAPLSAEEALDMLKTLKSYPLLEGARGGVRVKVDALVEAVCRFSQLALELDGVSEGEINPLRATAEGVVALDARFVL